MNNSNSKGNAWARTQKPNVLGSAVAKRDTRSPKDHEKICKGTKADTVVVEVKGKIHFKTGICATAILGKCQSGTYEHTIHWPEIAANKKIICKKKILVIKNQEGELSILGEKENIPKGSTIEFKSF